MTDLIEDCLWYWWLKKNRDWVNRTERKNHYRKWILEIVYAKQHLLTNRLSKGNSEQMSPLTDEMGVSLKTSLKEILQAWKILWCVLKIRLCRSVEAVDLLKGGMSCTSIIAYELCKEDRARRTPRCIKVTIPESKQIYWMKKVVSNWRCGAYSKKYSRGDENNFQLRLGRSWWGNSTIVIVDRR